MNLSNIRRVCPDGIRQILLIQGNMGAVPGKIAVVKLLSYPFYELQSLLLWPDKPFLMGKTIQRFNHKAHGSIGFHLLQQFTDRLKQNLPGLPALFLSRIRSADQTEIRSFTLCRHLQQFSKPFIRFLSHQLVKACRRQIPVSQIPGGPGCKAYFLFL